MRGVIPAQWLILLESKLGPVWEWADLVAGTSTGGILALLMGADVSALRAMDFYCSSGPRIFKQGFFRKLYTGGGLVHTKYRDDDLAKYLRLSLGVGTMAGARTKVMVTSMSFMREAVMVKSWLPEWADLSFVDAGLMTSAAQTYFPQAEWQGKRYLDGGNIRNNPSVCAITEALKLWPGEKLRQAASEGWPFLEARLMSMFGAGHGGESYVF